ncbi:trehalose transport-related protein [Dioszegia hungarica]|uniref:Trehalose transport-related protein n=1 Tax=Dioszegia hungarica TaxID=4972 RepID=A0AA38LUH0_9TREE|nr:trehalose transport-related protein [Dioszegia hungarica]KAI9635685.1 trehalose transport-related protein [Dioszegia hungarica]
MTDILIAKAQTAAEEEKAMPWKQAVRTFWRGGLFSMGLSVALIMEGYDIGLLKAFYGHPAFLESFGSIGPNGKLLITADWQAGLSNAVSAGQVCGLLLNGWASYTFGYRRTYICAMTAMIATIFIPVFAVNLPMLLAGNFINGIPWGVFQTLTTAYAAEICPMALRAHLTSFVNICWASGLFIAAAVVRGTISIPSQWGWRVPYILQWLWPVPLLVVAWFAPESPWWLARNGRREEARKSIIRTAPPGYFSSEDVDARMALMDHTFQIELEETKKASLFNCFKGTNFRRLEICCVVWSVQYWCGQPMTGYSSYFLQNAGLSTDTAFSLNLGNYSLLIFGTLVVWSYVYKIGRRRIYLVGQALMALELGIIGILGCIPQSSSVSYGIGALMLLLNLTFACTVGPVCYTIVAELPSAEVRAQTIVLARASYVISGIINAQITPRMLSLEQWNWGSKCGFFFLGTNILSFTYCYFRLPESRGRSYGELDVLFLNKVPARKFKTTKVEEFEAHDAEPLETAYVDQKLETEHVERRNQERKG